MNSNNNSNLYKLRDNIVLQLPYKDLNSETSIDFRNNFPKFSKVSLNKVLILDFSKVVLIDSHGLGALMYAWHECSNKGVHLILCNLNDFSYNFLKKKAFDTLLEIKDSLKEAISRGDEYVNLMIKSQQEINKLESFFGSVNEDNITTLPAKVYSLKKESKGDSKTG